MSDGFVQSATEAQQPFVPLERANFGNEMAAPEHGMTALLHVDRWTAEISGEIFVKFLFATCQIRWVNCPAMGRFRKRVH